MDRSRTCLLSAGPGEHRITRDAGLRLAQRWDLAKTKKQTQRTKTENGCGMRQGNPA